jgi:hypothetical protein
LFASSVGTIELNSRRFIVAVALVMSSRFAGATTIQNNTRPEVAQMAGFWEVGCVQTSSLAEARYPQIGGGIERSVTVLSVEEATT